MKPTDKSPKSTIQTPYSDDRSSYKFNHKSPERKTQDYSLLNRLFRSFRSGKNSLSKPITGHFTSLSQSPAENIPSFSPTQGNAYAVKVDPPTDLSEKIQLVVDAELAAYPYHRSFEKVQAATSIAENEIDSKLFPFYAEWQLEKELTQSVGMAMELPIDENNSFIYDEKTGLTAYIVYNKALTPIEVRLIFGGTTSGKKTGGLFKRSILNASFSLRQWVANAKNAVLGKIPDSYHQAERLAATLQQKMSLDTRYEQAKLIVTGHSKGGGEAEFAALRQKKPLRAVCFSSAELGSEMRKSLSEECKANAAQYVSHYNIQGDIVPNLHKLSSKLGHLGKVITLPSQSRFDGPMDRHDKFTRHIRHYAESHTGPESEKP